MEKWDGGSSTSWSTRRWTPRCWRSSRARCPRKPAAWRNACAARPPTACSIRPACPRLAGLRFTTDWDDFRDCGLIIETVFEDFQVKSEVLRQAEQVVPPTAVISSNTSSLSLTQLAGCLQRPERFAGYHFFHPVPLTTVVEIIATPHTTPQTVEFLRQVSGQINRRPLVVRDLGGGSCVNVPLTFLTVESMYVLEEGLVSPSRLDVIVGEFTRLGPCEGLDIVGVEFFTSILRRMLVNFPYGYTVPELCLKLIREGRLGRYGQGGIFRYENDRPVDEPKEYYLAPGQTHTPPGAQRLHRPARAYAVRPVSQSPSLGRPGARRPGGSLPRHRGRHGPEDRLPGRDAEARQQGHAGSVRPAVPRARFCATTRLRSKAFCSSSTRRKHTGKASSLKPQASPLKPQASSLAPLFRFQLVLYLARSSPRGKRSDRVNNCTCTPSGGR